MTYKAPGDESQSNNWLNPVTFKPLGYLDFIDLRDAGMEVQRMINEDGSRTWEFRGGDFGFISTHFSLQGDQRALDSVMEEVAACLLENNLVMQPWTSITVRGNVLIYFTSKKDMTKFLMVANPALSGIPDESIY